MQQLTSGSVLEQACGSCASATVNVAIEFLYKQELDNGPQTIVTQAETTSVCCNICEISLCMQVFSRAACCSPPDQML